MAKRPMHATSPATRRPMARKPLDRVYDVFLSHRKADEALVIELYQHIEQELHFDAYVDWKDSAEDLDRSQVTPATAAYLRQVMRHASSLIYVVGQDPGASRWTPWELGFFDGRQSARRIGIFLPEGVAMPAQLEYLGLYGQPLRKADLKAFLEDATLDVAAMDSAQSDQWQRHLGRARSNPMDYALSVLQWQFGFAANLLTAPQDDTLHPDRQPEDLPIEPAAWFDPWLKLLRERQGAIAAMRRQLQAAQRAVPAQGPAAKGALPDPAAWLDLLQQLGMPEWPAAWGSQRAANTDAARLATR